MVMVKPYRSVSVQRSDIYRKILSTDYNHISIPSSDRKNHITSHHSSNMSKSSSKKKEEKKRKRVKTSNPSDDEYEEDIVMEDLDLHKIPQPEVKLEDTVLGFTDLGHKEEKEEQIEAPLPQWMKNPNSIPDNKVPLSELASSIDGNIMRNITELGFTEFFPVQRELLPVLSRPRIFGGDLCVSAPTGSGKTLTYVIPIVQVLSGCSFLIFYTRC